MLANHQLISAPCETSLTLRFKLAPARLEWTHMPLQHVVTACCGTGERAVEALKEMDQQIIPWFQTAAGELLKEMPAEKALALALAKITGNTELKVQLLAASYIAQL